MAIRFAVVGTSIVASNFIEVLQENPNTVYIGSYSRSHERAYNVTQKFKGPHPFYSLEEITACPDVDAVYIASPNGCHKQQALACIAAHKHVLIEKPFCATKNDAQDVFIAAQKNNVIALEAMRPVHDPAYAEIKKAITKIGIVHRASLRFGKYSSRYDNILAGEHTNIFDTKLCTGALMDIGIYPIETMLMLFGFPQTTVSSLVLLPPDTHTLTNGPIDGCGTILAQYKHAICEISYSKFTSDFLPSQIEGERGTITIDALSCPEKVTLCLRGKAIRNAAKISERTTGDTIEQLHILPTENNMKYELIDFIDMVIHKAESSQFKQYTLEALTLTDSVRKQEGIKF